MKMFFKDIEKCPCCGAFKMMITNEHVPKERVQIKCMNCDFAINQIDQEAAVRVWNIPAKDVSWPSHRELSVAYCAVCNGTAIVTANPAAKGQFFVECQECHAVGMFHTQPYACVQSWNKTQKALRQARLANIQESDVSEDDCQEGEPDDTD